jgi:hypothetical protein
MKKTVCVLVKKNQFYRQKLERITPEKSNSDFPAKRLLKLKLGGVCVATWNLFEGNNWREEAD